MWLLAVLPYWAFYGALIAGVIIAVGASVINLRSAQVVGCLLIWASTWFIGGIENDRSWQSRVKEAEAKVALAEARSAEVNTVVVTKTLTKIKLVKEITDANTQYITKYVAKDLDADCRLTTASVMLHNSASQNEVSRSPATTTGETSETKASELLATVTENYGTYYEVVERLKGWQDWYWQQKKVFEELK